VTTRVPRGSPNPGSDFLQLCLKYRTPLDSEVAHVKNEKNLVEFIANVGLGKWDLAKQVRVGVYTYIHIYSQTHVQSISQ